MGWKEPNGRDVTVNGKWFVRLYGPGGELKDCREGWNIVTTNGKDFLASFMQSAAAAASTFTMKYVGIGTGTGAELAANTALGTETTRTTGTVSYLSGGIYQVTATFTTGVGTGDVTEYGLFSTATTGAGTIFSRDVESAIAKGANDTLTAVLQITLS